MDDTKDSEVSFVKGLKNSSAGTPKLDSMPQDYRDQAERLQEERIKEQQQKSEFRGTMYNDFRNILIAQHIGLAALSVILIVCDKIGVLSIIIPATLLETYGILKIMVQYVFSPGDFNDKK